MKYKLYQIIEVKGHKRLYMVRKVEDNILTVVDGHSHVFTFPINDDITIMGEAIGEGM